MSLTPRITLNEEYIDGLSCAICGNPNLTINRVEKYPDFVSCDQCGSAFVVENEGSWVMYGKIPADYPLTSQFALRQWTWLDAVAQRAADEREMVTPSVVPEAPEQVIAESPDQISESTPPIPEEIPQDQIDARLKAAALEIETPENEMVEVAEQISPFTEEIETPLEEKFEPAAYEESPQPPLDQVTAPEEVIVPTPFEPVEVPPPKREVQSDLIEEKESPSGVDQFLDKVMEETVEEIPQVSTSFSDEVPVSQKVSPPVAEEKGPPDTPTTPEDKPSSVPVGEPEPDRRFRVTIRGSRTNYPKNYCAHCLRTPVKDKTIMQGNLPDPNRPGKRKRVPLDLPFCKDCQKRMNAQSDGERNARTLTFLISGLIALIAIVITLVLGIIDFSENLTSSIIILLIVAVLGFSVPLLIGLSRASGYPPPRDAAIVLSTLLVNESGDDLTEFEWRNPGYAELFRQVNQDKTVGNVTPVKDRATFIEIEPADAVDEKEQQAEPEVRIPMVEEE